MRTVRKRTGGSLAGHPAATPELPGPRTLRLVQPARFEWILPPRSDFYRPERLCPWHQPRINWIPLFTAESQHRHEWDFKPGRSLRLPSGVRVNYMSFWKRPGTPGPGATVPRRLTPHGCLTGTLNRSQSIA